MRFPRFRLTLLGLALVASACSSSVGTKEAEVPVLPERLFKLATQQCGPNPSQQKVTTLLGVCVGPQGSGVTFTLKVEPNAGLVVGSHSGARFTQNVTLCWLPYSATYGAEGSQIEYVGLTAFTTFTSIEDQTKALVKITATAPSVQDLRGMLDGFNVAVQPWLNKGPFTNECVQQPTQVT